MGEGGRRKIINDFLNDFPPAGEVGGKIIDDFINLLDLKVCAAKVSGLLNNDCRPSLKRPTRRFFLEGQAKASKRKTVLTELS